MGINYCNQPRELYGCVNDAVNVQNLLIERFGYKACDMVLLVDDSPDPKHRPTRENIMAAMAWLTEDAKSDDSLFFHYSGHGEQVKDLDHDEMDGFDEAIVPVDVDSAGLITDDELHMFLVKPLPPGCRLSAIFDSCHSGSMLDLQYMYDCKKSLLDKYARASCADVSLWSSSRDSQVSGEREISGEYRGVMSDALISALNQQPHQVVEQLLGSIRETVGKRMCNQLPQLSSSHQIDPQRRVSF